MSDDVWEELERQARARFMTAQATIGLGASAHDAIDITVTTSGAYYNVRWGSVALLLTSPVAAAFLVAAIEAQRKYGDWKVGSRRHAPLADRVDTEGSANNA